MNITLDTLRRYAVARSLFTPTTLASATQMATLTAGGDVTLVTTVVTLVTTAANDTTLVTTTTTTTAPPAPPTVSVDPAYTWAWIGGNDLALGRWKMV